MCGIYYTVTILLQSMYPIEQRTLQLISLSTRDQYLSTLCLH